MFLDVNVNKNGCLSLFQHCDELVDLFRVYPTSRPMPAGIGY